MYVIPGSENKSVVLASTAIQLLDERKSPIAAGRTLGFGFELCRNTLYYSAIFQCIFQRVACDACSSNCNM